MKKIIFTLLMLFFCIPGFSQNMEIDSLVHIIEAKEHEIEDLKHRIVEIIEKEGYLTQAHPKFDWKDIIKLKKDKSYNAEVLDTIPKEAEIIVLEKEISYYKVKYEDQVGYVSSMDMEVEDTPITYLPYKSSYSTYKSTRSKRGKKPLDYSKPVHVRGHYRTTKSGKRVYVRPHTRRN